MNSFRLVSLAILFSMSPAFAGEDTPAGNALTRGLERAFGASTTRQSTTTPRPSDSMRNSHLRTTAGHWHFR